MTALFTVPNVIPEDAVLEAAKEALAVPASAFAGASVQRAVPMMSPLSTLRDVAAFSASAPVLEKIREAVGMPDLSAGAVTLAKREPKPYPPKTVKIHRRNGQDALFTCILVLAGKGTVQVDGRSGRKEIPLSPGTLYGVAMGESVRSSFEIAETLLSIDMVLWGTPPKAEVGRPRGMLLGN